MHTFKVVKEAYGWAVRTDCGMSTPFWSRAIAIQEANALCAALRTHGEAAEVVVEAADPADTPVVAAARIGARRMAMLLTPRRPLRR
jgi:hypothetical protein